MTDLLDLVKGTPAHRLMAKKATIVFDQSQRFVVKGGGEGSRGGNVIGHTSSGKPIYEHTPGKAEGFHKRHAGWSKEDHAEAAAKHRGRSDGHTRVYQGTSHRTEDSRRESNHSWHMSKYHNSMTQAHMAAARPKNPHEGVKLHTDNAHSHHSEASEYTKKSLVKGGGEGSRGGKVVGHTSSGKPIYQSHQHNDIHGQKPAHAARHGNFDRHYADYKSGDHIDAQHHHLEHSRKHHEAAEDLAKEGKHDEASEHTKAAHYHQAQIDAHSHAKLVKLNASTPASSMHSVVDLKAAQHATKMDKKLPKGESRASLEEARRYIRNEGKHGTPEFERSAAETPDLVKAKYTSRKKVGGRWEYTYDHDVAKDYHRRQKKKHIGLMDAAEKGSQEHKHHKLMHEFHGHRESTHHAAAQGKRAVGDEHVKWMDNARRSMRASTSAARRIEAHATRKQHWANYEEAKQSGQVENIPNMQDHPEIEAHAYHARAKGHEEGVERGSSVPAQVTRMRALGVEVAKDGERRLANALIADPFKIKMGEQTAPDPYTDPAYKYDDDGFRIGQAGDAETGTPHTYAGDTSREAYDKWRGRKSVDDTPDLVKGGGPFIGKRGGKWADPQHKIPWKEGKSPSKQRSKTIVVFSAAGARKVELPDPDEATATANAEFRDAIIDSIMDASDNMSDPKILPSSRSTDSRRAEYQPNAPDAVAFAFRSEAGATKTTYYVNREGSQFKVWVQPGPRQDPATGGWVDSPEVYVTQGTTDPDEVARRLYDLGPNPDETNLGKSLAGDAPDLLKAIERYDRIAENI